MDTGRRIVSDTTVSNDKSHRRPISSTSPPIRVKKAEQEQSEEGFEEESEEESEAEWEKYVDVWPPGQVFTMKLPEDTLQLLDANALPFSELASVVAFYVGSQDSPVKEYIVHIHALCKGSPVFRKGFYGPLRARFSIPEFLENGHFNLVPNLGFVRQPVFSAFVEFMHGNTITMTTHNRHARQDIIGAHHADHAEACATDEENLVFLWFFADSARVPGLQNLVIKFLIRIFHACGPLDLSTVFSIYSRTKQMKGDGPPAEEHPLRLLGIHQYAHTCLHNSVWFGANRELFPEDMFHDVMAVVKEEKTIPKLHAKVLLSDYNV